MTNVVEHSMTQRELLWAAVLDEINILKAKGATDADFQERATYELLWHNALAKRWQAVRNDMRTSQEVWEVVIELATPECLRDLADLAREWVPRLPESLRAAANDCAYNLELLADQKERGSYVLELDAIRVLADFFNRGGGLIPPSPEWLKKMIEGVTINPNDSAGLG